MIKLLVVLLAPFTQLGIDILTFVKKAHGPYTMIYSYRFYFHLIRVHAKHTGKAAVLIDTMTNANNVYSCFAVCKGTTFWDWICALKEDRLRADLFDILGDLHHKRKLLMRSMDADASVIAVFLLNATVAIHEATTTCKRRRNDEMRLMKSRFPV